MDSVLIKILVCVGIWWAICWLVFPPPPEEFYDKDTAENDEIEEIEGETYNNNSSIYEEDNHIEP